MHIPVIRDVFSAISVYNQDMKASQKTIDNQEPEVLDASTLTAIDKGVKSLDAAKVCQSKTSDPLSANDTRHGSR
jgi:hypothetical protein